MGLDSVELLFFVEDTFRIRLNASEAEQINTVQDFSNSVYSKVMTKRNEKCLSHQIFIRVKKAIKKLNFTETAIMPETSLFELFSNKNLVRNWKLLETEIGLILPELTSLDISPNLDLHVKFLGVKIRKRSTPILNGTVKQLINWIVSLNYKELINLEKITGKYEVERVIIGIIYNTMGIPINEIDLEHSIRYDLGID
ncbi:acyl carrier protein [Flammeovirga kamogawensis]|uniref:Acyl carrier protein n=1 Tax=Flammeovirga kamogawensis TaxID=373891 RepID=A0ABX8H0V4_9BACT|nr:acyl carrier protein [Flammeovirga kamogawensis]MBB6464145.1 acyl carrier protein [Flammeovirga kamogawensis]QWG09248.1 acyl carrier protein [Flammeovirga kamogawensis]TRX64773.1 acyl carrier protein [Flammeovirga kamogawensis]